MRLKRCRLTEKKQERLLEFFVGEMTARTAADLVGVNKTTAAYFYHRLREIIAWKQDEVFPLSGEVEVDESYFGGKRKGKRGRGAAGKVPVFGILKRGGRVYTKMIPDVRTETLMPIMERMIVPDSVVYTDCLASYNALDISDFHHLRINHSELFADQRNHINGIENFWNQAKRQMRKYNGVPKHHFHLFLKESEWRFNGGSPKQLLRQLKQWIKLANKR